MLFNSNHLDAYHYYLPYFQLFNTVQSKDLDIVAILFKFHLVQKTLLEFLFVYFVKDARYNL